MPYAFESFWMGALGSFIPETHRRGYENVATFSLLGGFVVMMIVVTVFA